MKEMIISIKGLNDIYLFVKKALEVPGDITIKRGRFCIDAKSILGVFSIDMSQNVTIEYPKTAIDFENFIKQFEKSE